MRKMNRFAVANGLATIFLCDGRTTVIDEVDLPLVLKYPWRLNVRGTGKLYAHTYKRISMHRLIMGAPRGMDVDHKNNNGLDNRRCNLREATRAQNMMNMRRGRGHSIFKGVVRRLTCVPGKYKWAATIQSPNGKRLFLGNFPSPLRAALAYDEAARREFGEFAAPNFPERFKNRTEAI